MTMAIALLLASLAAAPLPAPPFERDSAGRAVDGQHVRDVGRARVQRIAVLPDRTTGRSWGLPYLRAAVEDLNVVRPDAVFTVGDMVQGYTRATGRWDDEAAEYLDAVSRLVPAFYPTPGNHDVISGSRRAGDTTFADRYRERFGPLWYSVELDQATAIVLFSDEGLGDRNIVLGDGQLSWLAGALESARARKLPIFLLMHRPLWRYASVGWAARVQPLLERAGVDAVIAGHFHSLQRDPDVGGVQYHIVGTCGGMIDQHPLAGQLQHLTFVDCSSDGTLRVWHQPVGLVLPEDFVVKADQDRVFALREPAPAVRAVGSVPDPSELTAPAPAVVRLAVRNPTDVPVKLSMSPPGVVRTMDGAATWWTPGRGGLGTPGTSGGSNGWTSHVLADVDNPSTMATAGRERVTVAPGAGERTIAPRTEETVELPVTLLPGGHAALPPQLDLYLTFQDSKGRTVPVYLPTRVPIERALRAGSGPEPILAWDYSPYDTREANPTVRLTKDAAAARLILDVEVPDDRASAAPEWSAPDAKRLKDPHADAIRVLLDVEGSAPVDLLYEPFTTGCTAPAGVTCEHTDAEGRGWTARITVPVPPGAAASVQLGVADNDDTYHTQWRWLAPGGAAGRWRLLPDPAGSAKTPGTGP